MRKQKRWMAILWAVIFLCGVNVYAQETVDISRKGTISVTMTCGENPVPGGKLSLYRVGSIEQENGRLIYVLSGGFIESGADLTGAMSAELAGELAGYAISQGLSGMMEEPGEDGRAAFTELEPGLYLIVQAEAAEGYNKAAPFLVSLPIEENGVYIYDVDATPKVELEKEPAPPIPDEPPDPTLPQTGQLKWPVPVMAVLGMFLFSLGWLLRYTRKRNVHEK